jgi:hypothetical protein
MKHGMNSFATLLFLTLGLATLRADKAAMDAKAREYNVAAKAVVDMALARTVDVTVVRAKVDIMLASAVSLAGAYAEKFPQGRKLLDAVIAGVPEMKKLSFKELEDEWHDLKHFEKPGNDPGVDLKLEDNEHFTDPIHAIVHPLMVLSAAESYAKQKDAESLKQIKEEMEEGIEQAEKVRAVLAK